MTITLHAYGALVTVFGDAPVTIRSDSHTAGELLDQLYADYPALERWRDRIACACGDTLLGAASEIADGAEVALIPPVSGG